MFGSLTTAYALSVGLLATRGSLPDLPRTFIPYLIVFSLPCALTIVAAARRFETTSRVSRLLWAAGGLLLAWLSTPNPLWLLAAVGGAVLIGRDWSMRVAGRFTMVLVLLVIGYAAIWNFNSFLAPLSVGRLGDPVLMAVDLWILSSPTYAGVFPVIESRWTFLLLERAYMFLFAEVMTIALWLALSRPRDAYWWVAQLFTAYAIGLVVFLIWPTVGPHIYAPESLRPAWHDTTTFRMMQAMDTHYDRIIAGGRGGINYFIAFPSLHVAAAMICQLAVPRGSALFWLLLPVTALLTSSTFLLGYHYALDIPAGMVTALLASWAIGWLRDRSAAPSD